MRRANILFIVVSGCLSAQSPAIGGAGYAKPPQSMEAAPGQMISLMLYGFKAPATPIQAAVPLPPTLGGFSVEVQQGGPPRPLRFFPCSRAAWRVNWPARR